jgi:tripartite-type tricarboxylate transporter receptor subunit TctC
MSLALRAFAALLLSLVPFAQADAQQWPARPIRFIVSQAAGGTPDIICRMISEQLSVALGQPVVVEVKPGGSNIVGALAAARGISLQAQLPGLDDGATRLRHRLRVD